VEAAMSDPFASAQVDVDALQVLDAYPGSKIARHAKVAVSWETKAITRDLAPSLYGLTYVDNLTGAADELTLEIEDRDSLWSGDWRPAYGDKVVARLEYEPWFGTEPVKSLRLGTFAHDKINLKRPPGIVRLQAVSAPLATSLRRRKRTHVWKGVTLKQIAQDIADRADLSLDFEGDAGPAYRQALQNNKSDLEFLQELTKDGGCTVKVTELALVIREEAKIDETPSAGEIDLIGRHVIDLDFDGDDSGRYGSCHVSCFDPRTGKTHSYQYPPDGVTVPGLDPNGQTLELVIRVSSIKEAEVRAKSKLRNANRFATSGKLVTTGDPGLVAGVTFDLTNAAGFDGKFIITRAEHRVGSDGYTCSLAVRRCMEALP